MVTTIMRRMMMVKTKMRKVMRAIKDVIVMTMKKRW